MRVHPPKYSSRSRQNRVALSVSGSVYHVFRDFCRSRGLAMGAVLDRQLQDFLEAASP
jgi:hypothetical protein